MLEKCKAVTSGFQKNGVGFEPFRIRLTPQKMTVGLRDKRRHLVYGEQVRHCNFALRAQPGRVAHQGEPPKHVCFGEWHENGSRKSGV